MRVSIIHSMLVWEALDRMLFSNRHYHRIQDIYTRSIGPCYSDEGVIFKEKMRFGVSKVLILALLPMRALCIFCSVGTENFRKLLEKNFSVKFR